MRESEQLCKNIFTIKLHFTGNVEILTLQRSKVERNQQIVVGSLKVTQILESRRFELKG